MNMADSVKFAKQSNGSIWRGRFVRGACAVVMMSLMSGCSYLVERKAGELSADFSSAVMQQQDPQMVADALPAYLLLLDTLVQNNPENASLAMATARMNASFAGTFIDEPARQKIYADKAWALAVRSACLSGNPLCDNHKNGIDLLTRGLDLDDVEERRLAYDFATVWATWIQVSKDDFNAIAQLSRVEKLLESVARKEPAIDNGNAWVYLGVMNSLIPEALGGKPDKGRSYFVKALEISQGRNLMAKVMYAEFYARLVFDQTLHDKLVGEVLSSGLDANDMSLMNAMAKRRAEVLRNTSANYF